MMWEGRVANATVSSGLPPPSVLHLAPVGLGGHSGPCRDKDQQGDTR